MKTTIRKELEKLPYPYNKLALANEEHKYKQNWDEERHDNHAFELVLGFEWEDTPQGNNFWCAVDDWLLAKHHGHDLPALPEVKPEWLQAIGEPAPANKPKDNSLTKREQFAMAALQGLLATGSPQSFSHIAQQAVNAADELIKALEK